MIRLSDESLNTLSPILKQCSQSGIFISENGAFSALSNDRTLLIESYVAQEFSQSAHYDGYLLNKSGKHHDEKSELRYLTKSQQVPSLNRRISDVILKMEAGASKKSHFLLRNQLCCFIENRSLCLENTGISLHRTNSDLRFSITIDDVLRKSACKDEIVIHDFEGDECKYHFDHSKGILNEISRIKNEEFYVTVFHAGAVLLESTMRDFTAVKGAKITY